MKGRQFAPDPSPRREIEAPRDGRGANNAHAIFLAEQPRPSKPSTATLVCHTIWAVAAGSSVTACLCVQVILNARSTSPVYHSFYVTSIAVLLGGFLMLPASARCQEKIRKPKYCWSMMGGVCILPACISIPAGRQLGVQLVLLIQLTAMLITALVFDIRRGQVSMLDWWRIVGLVVVLGGTAVDELSTGSIAESFGSTTILLMLGVFLAGMGFAFQAKCNRRLSCDLGSPYRATAFSAIVATACNLPICAGIHSDLGVDLGFDMVDWALWAFVGLQSAFYIGSLAVLPDTLGYTASYLALLAGKLVSSSLVDAVGLTGHVVPFTAWRGASLALVLVGATLFSARRPKSTPSVDEAAEVMLDLLVSPCGPQDASVDVVRDMLVSPLERLETLVSPAVHGLERLVSPLSGFSSPRQDLKEKRWEDLLNAPDEPLLAALREENVLLGS